jgi:mono/diheme cytochrome c family protein
MTRRAIVVLSVIILFTAIFAFTQTKIEKTPAPYTSAASGQEMYKAYCASCHGLDGKGKGPAAPALKGPVPDLTTIKARNGGTFPSAHVVQVVRGDSNSPSHGSKDMPVWGPVFLAVSEHQPARVQQRAQNLTSYIESLQAK